MDAMAEITRLLGLVQQSQDRGITQTQHLETHYAALAQSQERMATSFEHMATALEGLAGILEPLLRRLIGDGEQGKKNVVMFHRGQER